MSGLEVVGAVASVVQLTSFAAEIVDSISKLCKKLRNAPKALRQNLDTIDQLRDVVLLLRGNEWLRAKDIIDRLESIAKKVDEALILLPKVKSKSDSRFLRLSRGTREAYKYMRNEEELNAVFVALEEMKSTLVLCVLNTQVRLIGETSENSTQLLELIPRMGEMQREFSYLRTLIEPLGTPSSNDQFHHRESDLSTLSSSSSGTYFTDPSTTPRGQDNRWGRANPADKLTASISDQDDINSLTESLAKYGITRDITATGHTYRLQSAKEDSRQINGNIVGYTSDGSQHQYIQNGSSGSSFQINGNICSGADALWSSLSIQSR